VLRDIVVEKYGNTDWYKALTSAVRGSIPADRLVMDLPISHVWRATDPKFFHTHVDWNACGAAFLIPATRGVIGGDLVVTPDVGDCYSVDTSFGKIIGGEWALKAHCNETVYAGDREVFVLYLDKRVCDARYVNCKSKSKILFSEEESLAMSAIRNNIATPVKSPTIVKMEETDEMPCVVKMEETEDTDRSLLPSKEDLDYADTNLTSEFGVV
jgi:hypothetical protein